VIYDLTLAMGGRKEYQTQFDSFTCCVGSGMETHARYGSDIYFHIGDALFVNQFIASELIWRDKGLVLRQETNFPDEVDLLESSTSEAEAAHPPSVLGD